MARILLVEDNELNRDMLSRRLVRNGYEVFHAKDGQQGVNMALSERPEQSPRIRLRRLRHQASRNLTLSWEDNGLA